jgi:hypothetical protein
MIAEFYPLTFVALSDLARGFAGLMLTAANIALRVSDRLATKGEHVNCPVCKAKMAACREWSIYLCQSCQERCHQPAGRRPEFAPWSPMLLRVLTWPSRT